jgi:hypothetical protein
MASSISSAKSSPKSSGGRSGSMVWNYFDYDESKKRVSCRECKQELAYNRNTSAMREHLKRKHVHINLTSDDRYV